MDREAEPRLRSGGKAVPARVVTFEAKLSMLIKIPVAVGLVLVTVFIHTVAFSVILRLMMRSHALDKSGFWPVTRWVIVLTCWLILIHLAEISGWGLFYFWQDCLPDAESAWYFSGVTYTGSGYGDLVLPTTWRKLAPVQTMTGPSHVRALDRTFLCARPTVDQ